MKKLTNGKLSSWLPPDLGFSIYPNGKKKSGLVRAWIESRRVTEECSAIGFLEAERLDWLLVLAGSKEAKALKDHGHFEAVISFQEFKQETFKGPILHRFAIARIEKQKAGS